MRHTQLTLSLDSSTAAALVGLAKCRGLSLDRLAHTLLTDGLSQAGYATPPDLRPKLSEDFERARSWPELKGRLRLKGYDLRGQSGDLKLVVFPSGESICDLSELEVEEAVLVRRMGRSFPNTARRWDWDLELDRPGHAARLSMSDVSDHAAKL